ncbi:MAG: hypothetical protein LUE22_00660 [Oscillospiraceae bacterium]|nr:hypothetical protein [Oscillospiraceae bacterium]
MASTNSLIGIPEEGDDWATTIDKYFIKGSNYNTANVLAYAQAISTASTEEQKMIMSTMELGAAKEQLVTKMIAGINSTAELTVTEIAETLAKTKGAQAETAAALATDLNVGAKERLSAADIVAAYAADKLADEDFELVMALYASKAATDSATASNISFATSMKLMFQNNPVMMVLSIVSVLATLFSLLKNNTDLFASAADKAETAREAYDDVCDQLDELNDEYDTNAERLEELQELADAGTITIVEQEELDNLETSKSYLTQKKKRRMAHRFFWGTACVRIRGRLWLPLPVVAHALASAGRWRLQPCLRSHCRG